MEDFSEEGTLCWDLNAMKKPDKYSLGVSKKDQSWILVKVAKTNFI